MAMYGVHFFCNECLETHPCGISITLDDGPPNKASIGDTYAGRDLPTEVVALSKNEFPCLTTGRPTMQENNDQVFLVPIG